MGGSSNGVVIRSYAAQLLESGYRQLGDKQKITLKFSNGWYTRCKERCQLQQNRMQEERRSGDNQAIIDNMLALFAHTSKRVDADVWNAGKFGLFYGNGPT